MPERTIDNLLDARCPLPQNGDPRTCVHGKPVIVRPHPPRVLGRMNLGYGKTSGILLDSYGTEFTANMFDAWAYERQIALHFITPGRPTENGFIESFNAKLRDECSNGGQGFPRASEKLVSKLGSAIGQTKRANDVTN